MTKIVGIVGKDHGLPGRGLGYFTLFSVPERTMGEPRAESVVKCGRVLGYPTPWSAMT